MALRILVSRWLIWKKCRLNKSATCFGIGEGNGYGRKHSSLALVGRDEEIKDAHLSQAAT